MKQNNSFLNRSKPLDLLLWGIEFGASKFLAATTALLAYTWASTMTTNLAGQFVAVGLVFIVVDLGISGLLRFYFVEKAQPDTTTNKAKKLFLNLIISFVIFKLVATATTSFWAAPDLAEYITGEAKTEYFASAINTEQAGKNERVTAAKSVWEKLENSEASRVKDAEKKGAALIRAAIRSGTPPQVEMYGRNSGFFYALNPRSKYYKANKAYISRVNDAKAKAAAMVEKEKNDTNKALNAYEAAQNDKGVAATLSFLTTAAENDAARHETKLSRHTNFIWLLDFISAFGLVWVVRIRTLRLKAGNNPGRQKTITSTLSLIFEEMYDKAIGWLESLLNIDIDGDGHIGATDNTPPDIAPANAGPDNFTTDRMLQQLADKVNEIENRQTDIIVGSDKIISSDKLSQDTLRQLFEMADKKQPTKPEPTTDKTADKTKKVSESVGTAEPTIVVINNEEADKTDKTAEVLEKLDVMHRDIQTKPEPTKRPERRQKQPTKRTDRQTKKLGCRIVGNKLFVGSVTYVLSDDKSVSKLIESCRKWYVRQSDKTSTGEPTTGAKNSAVKYSEGKKFLSEICDFDEQNGRVSITKKQ